MRRDCTDNKRWVLDVLSESDPEVLTAREAKVLTLRYGAHGPKSTMRKKRRLRNAKLSDYVR